MANGPVKIVLVKREDNCYLIDRRNPRKGKYGKPIESKGNLGGLI